MPRPQRPDYVHMACVTASVSYRESLTPDELIGALISAEIPENRRAHLRTLLDEGSPSLVQGLVQDVAESTKSEKVLENLRRMAKQLDALPRVQEWLGTL